MTSDRCYEDKMKGSVGGGGLGCREEPSELRCKGWEGTRSGSQNGKGILGRGHSPCKSLKVEKACLVYWAQSMPVGPSNLCTCGALCLVLSSCGSSCSGHASCKKPSLITIAPSWFGCFLWDPHPAAFPGKPWVTHLPPSLVCPVRVGARPCPPPPISLVPTWCLHIVGPQEGFVDGT